ncbi:FAD-dependent monooxygenase [Actinomadura kijaniata]|uniref:FAD-dependent monooxygenase n=1 Tax=Actinomadura kijaniata TaxID=46161 RepID=UPI00082EE6F3|nr:FAD-dependent monooxygenase [Actinomadura kijaniata]
MNDVLISGASVAGPALAHWLTRHGYSVTIVEKAPELRDGGYAVDFRGRAHLTVLRRMGILDQVHAARTGLGPFTLVNADGEPLVELPGDLFSGDIEILRGDLGRILYDLTKDRAEYRFGDSIAALEEDGDGVTVTFDSGPTRRFDLVIGADGLHSNVRRLAFGPEERFVRHLGLHTAVFSTGNLLGLDHAGLGHNAPGRVVGFYSARHDTEGRAVFFWGSPELEYDRYDTAAQKRILAERYADVGWVTPRLLAALDDAPDFYFDAVAQVRMDTWTRGRVALAGDAAHCPSPLSGMGTGLAMVGAYVLAGELVAAGGDHRVALPRYERVMRPYAQGCLRLGQGAANFMVPPNRLMNWFVRANYRVLPYLPWKGLMARAARNAAEGVDLPDHGL